MTIELGKVTVETKGRLPGPEADPAPKPEPLYDVNSGI